MGSRGSGAPDDIGNLWLTRIEKAIEYKKKWSQRMKCDKMETYYMGNQWEPSGTNYEPYVINLIFSTIEIKLPTLLFTNPIYHVKPKPISGEYDFDMAMKKSLLREDILNTMTTSKIKDFADHIEAVILDAFFRFGVIRIGYDADWTQNPNADKPILRSDSDPESYYRDPDNNVIKQPAKLPKNERIYVERIHARNFYVGGINSGPSLEECNWCAYYKWARIEDLQANPNLDTEKLNWAGGRSQDFVESEYGPEVDELVRSGDICKLWHVFDIRAKKELLIADPQATHLATIKYKRLPIKDLRFHKLTEGFYPLPPATNWKSPQDEYNEAREQFRNHRKRFTRKFLFSDASIVDEEEVNKLMNGGDGTFVRAQGDLRNAVAAVENADLGATSQIMMSVTKDDFNNISGVTEEERGQAGRTTATQANIVNQKAAIRDSRSRLQIADFLSRIGKEILLTFEENFTYGQWVRMVNKEFGVASDMQGDLAVWHEVFAADLEDENSDSELSFDVDISLDSMSPVENDQQRQAFILFISTLQQFPELSADPELVRETAFKCGYRNEKSIKNLVLIGQLMLTQKLQQLGMAAPGAAQNMAASQIGQGAMSQAKPPIQEQINNQLQNPATARGGLVQ